MKDNRLHIVNEPDNTSGKIEKKWRQAERIIAAEEMPGRTLRSVSLMKGVGIAAACALIVLGVYSVLGTGIFNQKYIPVTENPTEGEDKYTQAAESHEAAEDSLSINSGLNALSSSGGLPPRKDEDTESHQAQENVELPNPDDVSTVAAQSTPTPSKKASAKENTAEENISALLEVLFNNPVQDKEYVNTLKDLIKVGPEDIDVFEQKFFEINEKFIGDYTTDFCATGIGYASTYVGRLMRKVALAESESVSTKLLESKVDVIDDDTAWFFAEVEATDWNGESTVVVVNGIAYLEGNLVNFVSVDRENQIELDKAIGIPDDIETYRKEILANVIDSDDTAAHTVSDELAKAIILQVANDFFHNPVEFENLRDALLNTEGKAEALIFSDIYVAAENYFGMSMPADTLAAYANMDTYLSNLQRKIACSEKRISTELKNLSTEKDYNSVYKITGLVECTDADGNVSDVDIQGGAYLKGDYVACFALAPESQIAIDKALGLFDESNEYKDELDEYLSTYTADNNFEAEEATDVTDNEGLSEENEFTFGDTVESTAYCMEGHLDITYSDFRVYKSYEDAETAVSDLVDAKDYYFANSESGEEFVFCMMNVSVKASEDLKGNGLAVFDIRDLVIPLSEEGELVYFSAAGEGNFNPTNQYFNFEMAAGEERVFTVGLCAPKALTDDGKLCLAIESWKDNNGYEGLINYCKVPKMMIKD